MRFTRFVNVISIQKRSFTLHKNADQVQQVVGLLQQMVQAGSSCPCHSTHICRDHQHQGYSTQTLSTEYAFEMATSTIRYGLGVTREVGMDLENMNAKRVALFTDKNLIKLLPIQTLFSSLKTAGLQVHVFDETRVEPTDTSMLQAIEFSKKVQPDAYVAFGGGSVMDTAKVANLYTCHPEADFLDFVNAPIGKGLAVAKTLKPLIAIPTTAGTGSETTGVAIFDYEAKQFKTGIASRALKPTLGIIDPINSMTMPPQVRVASGLDVLCHSLESLTALPYYLRTPRPSNPLYRPAYQGSNPISDIWAARSLEMCVKYIERSYKDPNDKEAHENMLLAATFAGVGFGNAGVHLCHGMSYPISGLNESYHHPAYQVQHPIIPHGISVAITAPAVFRFTAKASPDKHLLAARAFGVDVSRISRADAGIALSDALRNLLYRLDVPNGISALGYRHKDIPDLVQGTLPQHRVTQLSPEPIHHEHLAHLFESSMTLY